MINWSSDQQGELEWVVIRTSWLKQDSVKTFGWKRETRWIYYDREKFEIYERRGSNQNGADAKTIELVDQGSHGFAGIGRVPVFELKVGEGLWLTNKIALLQLEHFNKSNALGWALTMGLFAMPVIYSDKEFNPDHAGESYYIQLGPDDRFGWTEPAGNVFPVAARAKSGAPEGRNVPRVLSDAAGGRRVRHAPIGSQQTVGLRRYAGNSAGLRGHC